jgi:hypothetical protein
MVIQDGTVVKTPIILFGDSWGDIVETADKIV